MYEAVTKERDDLKVRITQLVRFLRAYAKDKNLLENFQQLDSSDVEAAITAALADELAAAVGPERVEGEGR